MILFSSLIFLPWLFSNHPGLFFTVTSGWGMTNTIRKDKWSVSLLLCDSFLPPDDWEARFSIFSPPWARTNSPCPAPPPTTHTTTPHVFPHLCYISRKRNPLARGMARVEEYLLLSATLHPASRMESHAHMGGGGEKPCVLRNSDDGTHRDVKHQCPVC